MQNFLLMIQFPLWLGITFLSAILCNLCHGLREREENSHVKLYMFMIQPFYDV